MFKLKTEPEDFIVKEVIDLKIKDRGPYAYFLLKKKNWSTLKAVEAVARALRVDRKKITTAGMKDKHGITEQYCCIKYFDLKDLQNITIKDLTLTPVGYGNKRIGVGSLSSNQFTITVRNLEEPLTKIIISPNYYDDQRFGEIRPNTHIVGKYLLQRNYEQAMKTYLGEPYLTETPDHQAWRENVQKNWGKFSTTVARGMHYERYVLQVLREHPTAYTDAFSTLPRQLLTLFIQAYQSYLYNKLLNNYIEKNYKETTTLHTVAGDYTTPITINKEDKELEIPMIGYTKYETHHTIQNMIEYLLKKERIQRKNFENKKWEAMSSKTLMRKAFINVKDITLGKLEPDEKNKNKKKQVIQFKLPKGSYATMVIKNMYAQSNNPQSF
ncbi:MAG: tRNA pseudouridine(13) synthase TruD [Nanoarchaeota archaeon]|nr:tRNA pseudouridine(13) synthase TruD [Nanoarchaeota archaeon]